MGLVLLIHNESVSLWGQDEAAYAGFSERMVSTGNWLIPEFTWAKIHRKPPLHFWNIALTSKVFGMNEFSVRFPSAFFIFLTLIFLYRGTRAFLDQRTAFLSSVILGTSLFVISLAKISVTDGTLLFFSTVCAGLMISQLYSPHWKNVFFFWLSFVLALLVKGPPIVIFIGAVLFFKEK